MKWTPPEQPKLYHIIHVDRLPSTLADGHLYCDSRMSRRSDRGTMIGMSSIKTRRLTSELATWPGLCVGDCVPFYFCSRSIMLFLIDRANHPELSYRGGQELIVHLQFDMNRVVEWAENSKRRWAFTLSNAGSKYAEVRCNLYELDEVNWDAVSAHQWAGCKEEKQAEFLVENSVPWELVEEVGAINQNIARHTAQVVQIHAHRPLVQVRRNWYY
jgi:ssDNA thymidine ADP-ribosyltransferase, DarT